MGRESVVNQPHSSERVLVVHGEENGGAVIEGVRNATVDNQTGVKHARSHLQSVGKIVLRIL